MERLLSLLPLLACPVGMGLMMWLMMRMPAKPAHPAEDSALVPKNWEREPAANEISTADRLAQLGAQLQTVMAEQGAIVAQIESLTVAEIAGSQEPGTLGLAPMVIHH